MKVVLPLPAMPTQIMATRGFCAAEGEAEEAMVVLRKSWCKFEVCAGDGCLMFNRTVVIVGTSIPCMFLESWRF